jgi:hydroxymethylbilane synthase
LIGVTNLDDLRPQAVIGTSSPRRAAQLKAMRPDLETRPIRGNVATRMAQVAAGEFDATLLAAAGLDRLGQPDVGTSLPLETMLPAAAQGAIGIDHLASRDELAVFLQAVNHPATFTAVTAERAFLEALGGNCHSPVAAHATCNADTITLRGEILSEDGSERHSGILEFASDDHEGPARLAHALLEKSSDRLRHLFAP